MTQICFSQTNFYLYVLGALLIIGVCLYQFHQNQIEQRDFVDRDSLQSFVDQDSMQQIDHLTRQVEGLVNQGSKEAAQRGGQIREDYERLVNPLIPPYRRAYNRTNYYESIIVPINIPSRGEYGGFQVIGYLYQEDEPEKMMRLFGRRIYSDVYEYYTTNHIDPYLKIPLHVHNDRQLYTGDSVFVPGYKTAFIVRLYDVSAPRYIPY